MNTNTEKLQLALQDIRGNTLVGVLIAIGLGGIAFAGITSILDHSQRVTRALTEKTDILQLRQELIGNLSNANLCACNFDPTKNSANATNLRFNSTSLAGASLTIATVFSDCTGGVPGNPLVSTNQPYMGGSGQVTVQSMRIENLRTRGGNQFSGEFRANFDSSRLVVGRKPIVIPINFQADVANPASAAITSCATGSSGGGGGAGGGGGSLGADCDKAGIPNGNAPLSGMEVSGTVCWGYHWSDPGCKFGTLGMAIASWSATYMCINGNWVRVGTRCIDNPGQRCW